MLIYLDLIFCDFFRIFCVNVIMRLVNSYPQTEIDKYDSLKIRSTLLPPVEDHWVYRLFSSILLQIQGYFGSETHKIPCTLLPLFFKLPFLQKFHWMLLCCKPLFIIVLLKLILTIFAQICNVFVEALVFELPLYLCFFMEIKTS